MRIDLRIQTALGLALAAALFAGCGGGGSMTPVGGMNANAAARGAFPGSAAQSAFDQPFKKTPSYSQIGAAYPLSASGETIKFPKDGDATSSSKVPAVTTTPLPTLNFCESNAPITGTTGGCTTAASASPSSCKEAANTFWYSTLELTGGPEENHFASSDIPDTFKSPTLIPSSSKSKYGLCVVAFGIVLQDDFASGGKPVSQKKSEIKLKVIIPKDLNGDFPSNTTASVFFQHD